jgi:ribosomal protein L40E
MLHKSTVPSKPLVMPENLSANDSVQIAETKECPHCAELIEMDATSCRHCGKDLPETAEAGMDPWDGYDL